MKSLLALALLVTTTLISLPALADMTWEQFDQQVMQLPEQVDRAAERANCPVEMQLVDDVPAAVIRLQSSIMRGWKNNQASQAIAILMEQHGDEIISETVEKCGGVYAEECAMKEVANQFALQLSAKYKELVPNTTANRAVGPAPMAKAAYRMLFVFATVLHTIPHLNVEAHLAFAMTEAFAVYKLGTLGLAPENKNVRGFFKNPFKKSEPAPKTGLTAEKEEAPKLKTIEDATTAMAPFLKKYLNVSDSDFILDQQIVAYRAFQKLPSAALAIQFVNALTENRYPLLGEDAIYQILLVGLNSSVDNRMAKGVVKSIVKSLKDPTIFMPRLQQDLDENGFPI